MNGYYEYIANAELGGNDKIWGGDNLMEGQLISGGWYDDKIWTGNNVGEGSQGGPLGSTFDLLVYGDNDDRGNYSPGDSFPGADYGMPLIE